MVRSGGVRGGAFQRSELAARVVSALVLVPLALAATWVGGWPFALLWLAAGTATAYEGIAMADLRPMRALVLVACVGLIAVTLAARLAAGPGGLAGIGAVALLALCAVGRSGRDRAWAAAAFLYASLLVIVPVLVRDRPELGIRAVLWMFAVVWATDVAAYFVGRRLGGPKLWPRVSPGKTWSGFCGGLFAATLAGLLVAFAWRAPDETMPFSVLAVALASALASVASQLGDLGESALKRLFAVKDSGRLIPGHGGFMDRLDGFVAVAFLVGLVLLGARLTGPQG